MKKCLFLVILFFSCPLFSSSIGEDCNQFTLSLFPKLEKQEENLAFSPLGIFSNLSLLYFGAEGAPAREIKNALHISGSNESFLKANRTLLASFTRRYPRGYELELATGLFPHKGTHFLHEFAQIGREDFHAKLQALDFDEAESALASIDSWLSEKTGGKVSNLLKPGEITSNDRLISLSAAYFQGEWVQPFHPQLTQMQPFYPLKGEKKDVPTMEQTNFFPYYETKDLQCVALPLLRHDVMQPFLECLILLPKKRDGLHALEERLTHSLLLEIIKGAQQALLDLHIPKFCISRKLDLEEPLEELGVKTPFTYQANFSNINGMKDLFLAKMLHKTLFSFHEKGITAATLTHREATSIPPSVEPSTLFTADHPFLFLVVDSHSKMILFLGRVTHPSEAACNES